MARLSLKMRENLISQARIWIADYAIDLTRYCKPVVEYHDETESGAAWGVVSFRRKGRNEVVALEVEYMTDEGEVLQGRLCLR